MRPFVSFCISSYNQKEYFLEALEGALEQDYPYMEIVVSDDCSTDGSQEAIRKRVERYRAEGGRHPVVLQFNEKNLGIVKNREGLYALAKGQLIVNADGDDISLPNRVSRVVEEWEKAGARHTVVYHGYAAIDENGAFRGNRRAIPIETPMGAVIAYDRRVVTEFPAVSYPQAIDDFIFGHRAMMLGDPLVFDEPLIKYREVGGVSRKSNMRRRMARIDKFNYYALEQSVIDLESVCKKMSNERYEKMRKLVAWQRDDYHGRMLLTGGASFCIRWRGFRELRKLGLFKRQSRGFLIYAMIYLMPAWLCDMLMVAYEKLVLHRQ